jgi:hypothetical protein
VSAPSEPAELYGLPLEEFTAARNALAKQLVTEGRREEAEAVRRLAKPSRTAWALNQLARRRPDDIERLLEMGDRVRHAQSAALDGDATQLRATAREEQELVEELLAGAVGVLASSSPTPSSTQERMRRTLRAAALDPEAAAQLREGRLVSDVEPSGFGILAMDDDVPGDSGAGGGADRIAAEQRRQAEREAARLRKDAERAVQRARRLWDEAERAERRAAEARDDADRAAETASEAQHQADQAVALAEEAAEPAG